MSRTSLFFSLFVFAVPACGNGNPSSTTTGGTGTGASGGTTTAQGGGGTGQGAGGTTSGQGGTGATGGSPTGGSPTGGSGGMTTSTTGTTSTTAPIDCTNDPKACPAGQGCACGGPGGALKCVCGPMCKVDTDCTDAAQPVCCMHPGAQGICTDACTCNCK